MKALTLLSLLNQPSLFNFSEDFGFSNEQYFSYWSKENDIFKLSLEMPGIKKADLKIEVIENSIKISAKNEKRNYQFSTSYPKNLNVETLEASLEDGVLELSAKVKENPTKLIQIK